VIVPKGDIKEVTLLSVDAVFIFFSFCPFPLNWIPIGFYYWLDWWWSVPTLKLKAGNVLSAHLFCPVTLSWLMSGCFKNITSPAILMHILTYILKKNFPSFCRFPIRGTAVLIFQCCLGGFTIIGYLTIRIHSFGRNVQFVAWFMDAFFTELKKLEPAILCKSSAIRWVVHHT